MLRPHCAAGLTCLPLQPHPTPQPDLSADAAHPKALLDLLSKASKPYRGRDLPLLQALLQYMRDPPLANAFVQLAPSVLAFFMDPATGLLFNMAPEADLITVTADSLRSLAALTPTVQQRTSTALLDLVCSDKITTFAPGESRSALAHVVASVVGDTWLASIGSDTETTTGFAEAAVAMVLGGDAGELLCGSSPALRAVLRAIVSGCFGGGLTLRVYDCDPRPSAICPLLVLLSICFPSSFFVPSHTSLTKKSRPPVATWRRPAACATHGRGCLKKPTNCLRSHTGLASRLKNPCRRRRRLQPPPQANPNSSACLLCVAVCFWAFLHLLVAPPPPLCARQTRTALV